MSYEYARRRTPSVARSNTEANRDRPSPEALRIGAAQPTREQLGRPVDLPEAMRSKMEDAFGVDLSAVRLYESEAVADAGANAVAQGTNIAFAPGMLDFTSFGGQALLGHEISHVVSQARGEVTGGGFLNDASLEARADREGLQAAAGQAVAEPTASLSPVSAASAAGPMQASKGSKKLLNAETLTPEMIQKAKLKDLQREDVQDRVLREYTQDISEAVSSHNNDDRHGAESSFRENRGGATKVYIETLKRLAAPYIKDSEKQAMNLSGMERVNAAGNFWADTVEGDKSLSHMIAGAKGAFEGSTHFADDTSQGELLMNSFMLRAVAPQVNKGAGTWGEGEENARRLGFTKDIIRATNQNMTGVDIRKMANDTVLTGSSGMKRLLGTAQRLWANGVK